MSEEQNPSPSPRTDIPDAQPLPRSGTTGTLGELPDQPLGLPGVAGVPAQSQSPRAPGDQEQDAQLEE